MPKFYLDLHECGLIIADEHGFECPDLAAVRVNALTAARSVMAADVQEGRLCLDHRIEVRDAKRRSVMTLPFKSAIELSGNV